MKSVLFFVLCGVTCCLAVNSKCPNEELSKCPGGVTENLTPKEALDAFCRNMECQLEIADRCGDDYFGPIGYYPIKGFRKMYNGLCFKFSPLRGKYLYHAECLNNVMKDREALLRCGFKGDTREEFCRNIRPSMRCAVNYVKSKCGEDAGDVVQVASPGLDPYDCLQ